LRAYQETRAALESFTIKDKPLENKEKPEAKEKGEREEEKEVSKVAPFVFTTGFC
jgi:hypothetical protein